MEKEEARRREFGWEDSHKTTTAYETSHSHQDDHHESSVNGHEDDNDEEMSDNENDSTANADGPVAEFTVWNAKATNKSSPNLHSVVADYIDDQSFATTVAHSVETAKANNTQPSAEKRHNKNINKLLRGNKRRQNDVSSWGGLTFGDDLASCVVKEEEPDEEEHGDIVWKMEDLQGSCRSVKSVDNHSCQMGFSSGRGPIWEIKDL